MTPDPSVSGPPAGAVGGFGLPAAAQPPTPVGPVVATADATRGASAPIRRRDRWIWALPIAGLSLIASVSQLTTPTVGATAGIALLAASILYIGEKVLDDRLKLPIVALALLVGGVVWFTNLPEALTPQTSEVRSTDRASDVTDRRGERFSQDELDGLLRGGGSRPLEDVRAAGAEFDDLKAVRGSFDLLSAPGASFVGADLRDTTWDGADLRGADFTNACLSGADFTGARIDGLIMVGAGLADVELGPGRQAPASWPRPTDPPPPGCPSEG